MDLNISFILVSQFFRKCTMCMLFSLLCILLRRFYFSELLIISSLGSFVRGNNILQFSLSHSFMLILSGASASSSDDIIQMTHVQSQHNLQK